MHIVVFITVPDARMARRISRALVEKRLAACVSAGDNVSSLFWWEGRVDTAREVLLIAKSTKAKLPRIVTLVRSMHSYAVPEIIALPVVGGSRAYLDWIDESIRQPV
ncbi:MAG: divalent-cation tolerance protein CutA [Candidatus Omnitrophica bacterium]|nr:divalent-cation tolerance protein CutA [Candidatus Omnitrophota bacterium]MDD5774958.1 divalent-cation tolerance protein CutA [Candidatus Omnitrophota bacterium]